MKPLNWQQFRFPDPALGARQQPLAVGGDLSPGRLLAAYRAGIFPWFSEDDPILWWCPDPRFVLLPEELRVSASLRREVRKSRWQVTCDTVFPEVIHACSAVPRPGQDGTWILPEMIDAYCDLHECGYAHSVECWRDGELVGGLYGIAIGSCFFGESMFFRQPNASKVAFVRFVEQARQKGFTLIDCQVPTDHLATFGARAIPRREFLQAVGVAIEKPATPGKWTTFFDPEN